MSTPFGGALFALNVSSIQNDWHLRHPPEKPEELVPLFEKQAKKPPARKPAAARADSPVRSPDPPDTSLEGIYNAILEAEDIETAEPNILRLFDECANIDDQTTLQPELQAYLRAASVFSVLLQNKTKSEIHRFAEIVANNDAIKTRGFFFTAIVASNNPDYFPETFYTEKARLLQEHVNTLLVTTTDKNKYIEMLAKTYANGFDKDVIDFILKLDNRSDKTQKEWMDIIVSISDKEWEAMKDGILKTTDVKTERIDELQSVIELLKNDSGTFREDLRKQLALYPQFEWQLLSDDLGKEIISTNTSSATSYKDCALKFGLAVTAAAAAYYLGSYWFGAQPSMESPVYNTCPNTPAYSHNFFNTCPLTQPTSTGCPNDPLYGPNYFTSSPEDAPQPELSPPTMLSTTANYVSSFTCNSWEYIKTSTTNMATSLATTGFISSLAIPYSFNSDSVVDNLKKTIETFAEKYTPDKMHPYVDQIFEYVDIKKLLQRLTKPKKTIPDSEKDDINNELTNRSTVVALPVDGWMSGIFNGVVITFAFVGRALAM